MGRNAFLWGLWVSTGAVLVTSAYQALSGHWISFFLFWPGFEFLQKYAAFLDTLASLHRVLGLVTGLLSIPVLVFAFLSRSKAFVRIFAVVGFVMVIVAALGGYRYVTSAFKDRWSLGQMADAFVGVFGAYFIQLVFMTIGSRFPWSSRTKAMQR